MHNRVWLVYGPSDHESFFLEEDEEKVDWTIHKDAIIGDRVLFYLLRPVSSIVGVGTVLTAPKKEKWAAEWCKVMPYGAKMRVDAIYDPPLSFRKMSKDEELVENWGLLRAQMQSMTGPQLVLPSILDLLQSRHGLELPD